MKLDKLFPEYYGISQYPYGADNDSSRGQRKNPDHAEIDVPTPIGVRLLAVEDSTITIEQYFPPHGNGALGIVQAGISEDGHRFAIGVYHCSKAIVPNGYKAKRGEVIGFTGNSGIDPRTGKNFPPHAHVGAMFDGVQQDWGFYDVYEDMYGRFKNNMDTQTGLPIDFSEEDYLSSVLNPDLARAKAADNTFSGKTHWLKFGKNEGRLYSKKAAQVVNELELKVATALANATALNNTIINDNNIITTDVSVLEATKKGYEERLDALALENADLRHKLDTVPAVNNQVTSSDNEIVISDTVKHYLGYLSTNIPVYATTLLAFAINLQAGGVSVGWLSTVVSVLTSLQSLNIARKKVKQV